MIGTKKRFDWQAAKARQRSREKHNAIIQHVVVDEELLSAYGRFLKWSCALWPGIDDLGELSLQDIAERLIDRALGEDDFREWRGKELAEKKKMPTIGGKPFKDEAELAEAERQIKQHQSFIIIENEDGTLSVHRREDYSAIHALRLTRDFRNGDL